MISYLEETLVENVMEKNVVTINKDMDFTRVCLLFKKYGIHHLLVSNSKNELEGIFTTTDAIHAINNNVITNSCQKISCVNEKLLIKDLMTTEILFYLNPKDTLSQALILFQANEIHCIPILEEGKIVGILSFTDLLNQFKDPINYKNKTNENIKQKDPKGSAANF